MKRRNILALAGALTLSPLSSSFAQEASCPTRPDQMMCVANDDNVSLAQSFSVVAEKSVEKPVAPAVEDKAAWFTADGVVTQNARVLLDRLEDAGSHGLNPRSYPVRQIKALIDQPMTDHRQKVLGNHLDRALIAYAQDMTGPRVNPTVTGDTERKYWRTAMTPRDIRRQYEAAGDVETFLTSITPKNPLYGALQTELARLEDPAVLHEKAPKGEMSNAQKRLQVIANLERLRWDKDRPERYVEVNLAGQTMQAVENGEVKLESKAIVGKTKRKFRTMEFNVRISGVRFNPTWTVPNSIKARSHLPKLKKNPRALDEMGMRFFVRGREIRPTAINWKARNHVAGIRMEQDAGPQNALGNIRILMYNEYDQYMHFTNQPELFDKGSRYLSSGCVRIEKAEELGQFILNATDAEMAAHKQGEANTDIRKRGGPMFYSVYRTTSLGPDGAIQYHADGYGRNKKLLGAMKRNGAIPAAPKASPKVKAPKPPVP
ncbi:MAG: L,D-transpeptidase family protein [Alphaproteobacteria bacterium]|nr:L,D-transpeptidase family protein [Alphaproteobacteria bacterium]